MIAGRFLLVHRVALQPQSKRLPQDAPAPVGHELDSRCNEAVHATAVAELNEALCPRTELARFSRKPGETPPTPEQRDRSTRVAYGLGDVASVRDDELENSGTAPPSDAKRP